MSDIDHSQIKAEIDAIMKGVKNIMRKIDALIPDETSEQKQITDQSENPASSDNRSARQ